MKKNKLQITNLEVKVPSKVSTRSNGIKKLADKTSRTFESRMLPRYRQVPPMPENLIQPQFSESSEKILKERYLLKGGDLSSGETIAERFWHVAYDLASAGFDFGETKTQVYQKAIKFYDLMVSQSFEPNSPTLMNSGKQNGLQYSACFVLPVEDSLTGIFDTIKYAALIHQSGGGCISSDARVWTTFCGIEPIEVLVSRAISDGRVGMIQGRGIAYDVSDLNIRTVAMNPQTAEIGLKEVTHVWQFDVPASQQISIITHQGTQVQTSVWHPFMVLRGTKLVETRADQLTSGDIILGPDRADSYWPWRSFHQVGSLIINEDLAWLIGFTLGDGSFGYVNKLRQYRVRWFSGTEDVLLKVQNILLKHGIKVSIQKDKRNLLSICTLNQRFVHDLLEACGLEKFGPKDDLIKVPEIIAKSPLGVVRGFLAGLIDSDGYVAADGSPSYSSVSEAMAQDLAALVSLLGFYPSVKSKDPYGKGRRKTYSVQLCTLPQVNNLADDLRPHLANNLRLHRLKSASRKQTALPLGFKPWRDLLFDLRLVKKRFEREGPGPISHELNYWSSHGRIDRDNILSIAEYVRPRDKKSADFLKRIALGGQEIKEVKGVQIPKKFYDLSVKDWNTYAAGSSGLVMIHNTGFAFSRLRPQGSRVKSTGGVASGPVSFLRVFDAATRSIKQGGTRRGANMGILRIDHPDILEFIRCKAELDDNNKIVYDAVAPTLPDDGARANFKTRLLDTQIANFNISAAVTDKFMQAYYNDTDYDLIDPSSREVVGKLNAGEVFSEIVDRAWSTGDPGMVFIDRINHSPANPIQDLEVIEATNPCGEQPLAPWDACNLGSINLGKFVKDTEVDWERLRQVTSLAVEFLDDVVQTNPYSLRQIYDEVHDNRRIGLGVMGWADMLFKLKVPYDCEEALQLGEDIMAFINKVGHETSESLAKERGAFPNWPYSIYKNNNPIRNSTVTTIAPTGTISIIADCSSGIEPVFALAYLHKARGVGDNVRTLVIANKTFEEIARREGFYSEDLAQKVMEHGSVSDVDAVPKQWQRIFRTAQEIDPDWHVKMQAAFQKYTDNGVSKTINLSNSATRDDVKRAYLLSWETGCKGITVYRDGCKAVQVLNVSSTLKTRSDGNGTAKVIDDAVNEPIEVRPMVLHGKTYKVLTPVGEAFVTINHDINSLPLEVFVTVGKGGMHVTADAEALGRMISLTLKASRGVRRKEIAQKIVSQLRGIGGASQIGFGKDRVMSLADAIAKVLAEELALMESDSQDEAQPEHLLLNLTVENHSEDVTIMANSKVTADLCPECGLATFIREDGCQKCYSCGYSKC